MKISKKTILNVILIVFVVSFFVTPLGYYGKLWLNRMFSFSPETVEAGKRQQIRDYDWKLKDANWDFFNFERSEGNVVFISFWASWNLRSNAELKSIQALYDKYKGKIDFYIITNEEREPVEEFMEKNEYSFPVTYLIIGEKTPISKIKPPISYVVDKEGYLVIVNEGIADWDNENIFEVFDKLISE